MAATMDYASERDSRHAAASAITIWLRRIAIGALIATLAWAPFPLGGAVSWGAGLQEMMIAACWLLWLAANWNDPAALLPKRPALIVALGLAVVVILWVYVQTLPGLPAAWVHPIWQVASEGLDHSVPATISANPWRTDAEILKLIGAVAAVWITYSMAQRAEIAAILFNAVIAIGTAYALYGFALLFVGLTQTQLVYGIPFASEYLTGPFMLHNSFATYSGLATLAAVAKLFDVGRETIIATRGARQLFVSLIQFTFGRGAPYVIAVIVLFAAVVASASRGGFAATSAGLAAMALLTLIVMLRTPARIWPSLAILAAVTPVFIMIAASGGQLGDRFDQLIDAGNADDVRLALWAATERMIADAPWRGMGLGTFQDIYPLYATQVLPFVMDKAHCDYLEFAAGVGLPAAMAWWLAMAGAGLVAARGATARRRNALYALTATGAMVLIAVHSSLDFSLQMPAVALCFGVLLGIGLAQSVRSRAA
jgi:O-antigen ligase